MKKQTLEKKSIFERISKLYTQLRIPEERIQMRRTFQEKSIVRFVNMRWLLGGSMVIYGFFFIVFARQGEKTKYQFSYSRRMSHLTGIMTNCPLPPYFRKFMYQSFGWLYGVNFDEIKVDDINKFRTFNQFFTRELEDGARTIENQQDDRSLSSPCDGKVLSFGKVDSLLSTIDCIKGHTYRLDEFLFGYKGVQSDNNSQASIIDNIIKSAADRGNKVLYAVIYLAPQDYHRFHSPANFIANYRRHIAGYLEPVRPSYLEKHKDVLKENERVNVLGEWRNGFFAISFIGALNVGSIKILFDEELKTNQSVPQHPYLIDKSYNTLNEDASAFISFPVRQKKMNINSKSNSDEDFLIGKYLNEFDLRDIIDLGHQKTSFEYDPAQESKFQYNILNGFRKENPDLQKQEDKHQELLSKLEQVSDSTESGIRRFTITPNGVLLRKGEQIGMFEMGSTIALLFECPPNYDFNFKEGDKLLMGQEILSQLDQ